MSAVLDLDDIQGLVARGFGDQKSACYVLVTMPDRARAGAWLESLAGELTPGVGQAGRRRREHRFHDQRAGPPRRPRRHPPALLPRVLQGHVRPVPQPGAGRRGRRGARPVGLGRRVCARRRRPDALRRRQAGARRHLRGPRGTVPGPRPGGGEAARYRRPRRHRAVRVPGRDRPADRRGPVDQDGEPGEHDQGRGVRPGLSQRVRPVHVPAAGGGGRRPRRAASPGRRRDGRQGPGPQRHLPRFPPAGPGPGRVLGLPRPVHRRPRRHQRPVGPGVAGGQDDRPLAQRGPPGRSPPTPTTPNWPGPTTSGTTPRTRTA